MKKIDSRIVFSALWAVVMVNMLKADVLSLYIPGVVEELITFAGDTPVTSLMLAGAVVMEFPILMIVLSLVLPYQFNRWANMILSVVVVIFIWAGGSAYPHYVFIGLIETVCLFFIFYRAWRWSQSET